MNEPEQIGSRDEKEQLQMAELELRLRIALQPREAPAGFEQRVLVRAAQARCERHSRTSMLQRIAASVVVAASVAGMAGGYVIHRQAEEQRRGEEARQQVLTAFRITSKTLDRVNERLADGR
jgi:hypothetical protein